MASQSGIRASSSDRDDRPRKPILKNAAVYIGWATKMESILDGEDCWDIVMGTEIEPNELGWVVNPGEEDEAPGVQVAPGVQAAAEVVRTAEIKDWKKRYKKAASLITQSVDDALVRILRVHNKNPILMWARLSADFNKVSPAQLALARRDFQCYHIEEDETSLVSRQNFDDLVQAVITQGGTVAEDDQLLTLLGSLPEKFESIRDTFYAQSPEPGIEYIWTRMYDKETAQKRRDQSSVMRGEVLFQSRGGSRGSSNRGRGRMGSNRGGSSGGRSNVMLGMRSEQSLRESK